MMARPFRRGARDGCGCLFMSCCPEASLLVLGGLIDYQTVSCNDKRHSLYTWFGNDC